MFLFQLLWVPSISMWTAAAWPRSPLAAAAAPPKLLISAAAVAPLSQLPSTAAVIPSYLSPWDATPPQVFLPDAASINLSPQRAGSLALETGAAVDLFQILEPQMGLHMLALCRAFTGTGSWKSAAKAQQFQAGSWRYWDPYQCQQMDCCHCWSPDKIMWT